MTDCGETSEGFWTHAREFFEAADLLLKDDGERVLPIYFLLGRSIELALKAYLLKSGVSIEELRNPKRFGHDLRALLAAAKDHGIEAKVSMGPLASGSIELLSYDYSGKRLEYRRTGGTYSLPFIEPTYEIARALAYDVETAMKGNE